MEVLARQLAVQDRDGRWDQMRVGGVHHHGRSPGLGQVDMDHLPRRVHACVGASGRVDAHAFAAEGCDGALDFSLD